MKMGLVSIMMPAYNAAQYIGQAIESVLSQSFTDWELIVVDDGSTDETSQVVQQFNDPRIKLIPQANGGEASARNTALGCMQGEYLAFLDADDLYRQNHLEETVAFLENHPELHGVYTDGQYCTTDGDATRSLSSQRRGPFNGWIFEQLVRASDVFGPPLCVVLRRDAVTQQDIKFDTRIVIGPDWDFLTRFSEFSEFGYLALQTCYYRIHPTNITTRTKKQKRAESLAICREKAIKLESFSRCSPETRSYAFYDLLINLLQGKPEEQTSVINWPEFSMLPLNEQAKLLRLMASQEIANGGDRGSARDWLRRSRKLHPGDMRGVLLMSLLTLSPVLCKWILRKKHARELKPAIDTPFGDLQ